MVDGIPKPTPLFLPKGPYWWHPYEILVTSHFVVEKSTWLFQIFHRPFEARKIDPTGASSTDVRTMMAIPCRWDFLLRSSGWSWIWGDKKRTHLEIPHAISQQKIEGNPILNHSNMEVSWVLGVPLVFIHFKRIFPHKPSSYWGTPMTMEILISSFSSSIKRTSPPETSPAVGAGDWTGSAGESHLRLGWHQKCAAA